MGRTAAAKSDPEPQPPVQCAPPAASKAVTRASASDVEAAAVWKDPAELHPWSKNPKPLEPKNVREMTRSIRRFGFGAPIVARAANLEIIEGHLRYAAARRMKLERVPVRLLDISADEAHLLAIAAWKFEHRRDVDESEVAAILDDLEDRGVDIEIGTGFEDGELDKLLEKAEGEGDEGDATSNVRGHTRRLQNGEALTYRILVECKGEEHQALLIEKFKAQGLTCKRLIG
jgi:hypothetical protein